MSAEYYTKKSDGWYKGCGCGMKVQDRVIPPASSQEGFVQFAGDKTGPVSGLLYHFEPNTTSIDLDPDDFTAWKAEGIARDPLPGYKGRLARVA